jgi:hypothetical protein
MIQTPVKMQHVAADGNELQEGHLVVDDFDSRCDRLYPRARVLIYLILTQISLVQVKYR